MRIVSADEMRRIDRHAIRTVGIPGSVLMESAGRSVYAEIAKREAPLQGKRAWVFAGPGNNGGDGFVIARYLHLNGVAVQMLHLGSKPGTKGDAVLEARILEKTGLKALKVSSPKFLTDWAKKASRPDFVVDALFGTGQTRVLAGVFFSAVQLINRTGTPVYSVDLPTGLHADTGEVLGSAVRATCTVTFGFKKRGFYQGAGPDLCGEIAVADISLDDRWGDVVKASKLYEITPASLRGFFPSRSRSSHKGSFGHVLVVAGSPEKSGAAILASRAALRAGAGLVTLAVGESTHAIVKSQLVEVMTESLPDDGKGGLGSDSLDRLIELSQGKSAVLIGPGLIPSKALRTLLHRYLSEIKIPTVLDADGLNTFGPEIRKLGSALKRIVLTPHPGEMSRLTGLSTKEVQADRIGTAREFSDDTGATVVLKGAGTVVAASDGATYINPTGNPGMATAGMGDVLAGMLASYLGQGLDLSAASRAAVFLHGMAGDRAESEKGARGLLASDLIDILPNLGFWKS